MFIYTSWSAQNDFTLLLCQFYISCYNIISIDWSLKRFRTNQDRLWNLKWYYNGYNALSGKMPQLQVVAWWFAFQNKTWKQPYMKFNFLRTIILKFKAFFGCPGTCTSFKSQRIAYWCNGNNPFLCLGQPELPVYINSISSQISF